MPTIINQLGLSTTDQVVFTQANQPVVEPLGGNISLAEIMSRFPDTVYQSGPDSRLYKLIQALCGDSGAGLLKAQSLAIRLKNEGPLLVFHDLDTFYAHIFNFPRIKRELYNYDLASDALLSTTYDPTNVSLEKEIWDKIHAADDSYRRRVLDFMAAARSGNSPKGMELAAKAGSGEDADVVENYHWKFDQWSDDPLDIEKVGDTIGTGEFIVMPSGTSNTNDNVDANVLTLDFDLATTSGTFSLTYESITSDPITFDTTNIATAIYNAILGMDSGNIFGLTDVTVAVDLSSNFTYTITINDPQLDALFFGINNGTLVGGIGTLTYPVGDSYYLTPFQYPLASFTEDNYDEITGGTMDADFPLPDDSFYFDNVRYEPAVHLLPELEYNMIRTLDHLRPVGTVMTVKPKRAAHIQVESRAVFSSSENFNLVRWVTGNPGIAWPDRDAAKGQFIQGIVTENGITANVENEGTTFAFGTHVFPALFQTITDVMAYTEDALEDVTYNTADFPDRYVVYKSQHQGQFDRLINLMFPFLGAVADVDQFSIELAVPDEPTPLVTNFPFVIS